MYKQRGITVIIVGLCLSWLGWPVGQTQAAPIPPQIPLTSGQRVAQASSVSSNDTTDIKQNTTKPSPFPAGAWALESVSASVAAAGFIMIGVGMTFLTQRTNLVNKASDPTTKTDNVALARDIRSLEDTGTGIYVAGFVAAGIGVVGMVVGAIWLLTHHPSPRTLPKNPSPQEYGKAALLPPSSALPILVIHE